MEIRLRNSKITLSAWLVILTVLGMSGVPIEAKEIPQRSLPPALRGVDLRYLSSGRYMGLAEKAGMLQIANPSENQAERNVTGVVLDPRVGPNTILGNDPR